MGSALGATGWAMGGVTGMRIAGGTKTAYDGAMGVVDIATNFIPGGKAFKGVKSIISASKMSKKDLLNKLTTP